MLRRADLRNQIERDRVGERFVLVLFVVERRPAAVDEVALAADAGAAGGLVGADDDAADAAGVVQRLHGDDHLRGRAVRAGDDALVVLDGVRDSLPESPAAPSGPSASSRFRRRRRSRARRPRGRSPWPPGRACCRSPGRCPRTPRASAPSTVCFLPVNSIVLPAERAEARNVIFSCGKSRSSSMVRMSWPTAPVAPTMAIESNTEESPRVGAASRAVEDRRCPHRLGGRSFAIRTSVARRSSIGALAVPTAKCRLARVQRGDNRLLASDGAVR